MPVVPPEPVSPKGLRIYEYADRDGTVYWSLSRKIGKTYAQLDIMDSRGVHLRRFVADLLKTIFGVSGKNVSEGG